MTDGVGFDRKIFKIRRDFEHGRIEASLLEDLYRKYNPTMDDVKGFVVSALRLFPRLNCGLASVYLKSVFPDLEIVQGRYKENNHTFCIDSKELVIDLTADQYGGPKVYVGVLQEPWIKVVASR